MIYTELARPRLGGAVFLSAFRTARPGGPGSTYYNPEPTNPRLERLANAEGAYRLTWEGASSVVVFLGGRLYDVLTGGEATIYVPNQQEPWDLELAATPPGGPDAARPTRWRIPQIRARLTWVRPAGTGIGETSTLSQFRVYWNAGSGAVNLTTPIATVDDTGAWSYAWLTPRLEDGLTYKIVIRPVDKAGNESASVLERQVRVRTIPEPVINPAYTYSQATKRVTIAGT